MTSLEQESASFILVLVTVGSETEALNISTYLVEHQLAACINRFEINSVYQWQGSIQNETEWQLMIKTHSNQFDAVTQAILTLHSYEVPEVIAIPILQGHGPYLRWLQNNSRGMNPQKVN